MRPAAWREMVERTRELEAALGSPEKRVADNERETVVVQRRSLRAARNLAPGEVLTARDIEPLRPATPGCLAPYDAPLVIGMRVAAPIAKGEGLRANQFQENRAGAV
jgi:N-acetylneuraminate synthase